MKWLRRLLSVAALLVAVLIAAAALLPRLVDGETLRGMLVIAARAHTGRELAVEGEVRFALLPQPAVVLPRLRLANAEGFGAEPFASLDGARANLRLWPLLRGRLQVASVRIDRPQLRLMIDARGRSNWADLSPAGQPASPPPEPSGSDRVMARLAGRVGIAELALRGGDVLWTDQRSGRWARLHDLDVALAALDPGGPLPLTASAMLDTGDPQRSARLDLAATLRRSASGTWDAPDLRVGATLSGAPLRQALTLRLRADAAFDPAPARLRLRRLALDGDPLQLRGELTLARDHDAPVLGAQVRLKRLDLRALASAFGKTLTTADPQALSHVSGNLEVGASAHEINLARLELALDESQWRGSARLENFSEPAVRFALAVDRLDLDRYLPGRQAAHPDPTATAPAPAPAAGSPAEVLRRVAHLDLDGTLDAATVNVRQLSLERVALRVRSGGGQIVVQPLDAGLYGGSAQATARVDARRGEPTVRLKLAATDVAAGPLLAALTGADTLQGRFALDGELTGTAAAGDAWLRSLNGALRLNGSDGVLEGINADRSICLARTALAGKQGTPTPACDPSPDTRFSALRLGGRLAAGVWRGNELLLEQRRYRSGRFYRLTGAGTLDLTSGEMDYRLKAATVRRDGPRVGEEVRETPVALRVRGRPGDFTVSPQLADALRGEAARRLRERLVPDAGAEGKATAGHTLRGLPRP